VEIVIHHHASILAGFLKKKMVPFVICRVRIIPKRKSEAERTGFWRGQERRQAGACFLAEGQRAVKSSPYKAFSMVARKSRLPYEEFRARGYREMATPCFSVRARKNSLKENRFGVIAGVSSIKNAAHRNFWRRQTKFILLKVPQKGFDFLVILRRPTALSSKSVFRKTLSITVASLISSL
jgi:ribonuclease P protein component